MQWLPVTGLHCPHQRLKQQAVEAGLRVTGSLPDGEVEGNLLHIQYVDLLMHLAACRMWYPKLTLQEC